MDSRWQLSTSWARTSGVLLPRWGGTADSFKGMDPRRASPRLFSDDQQGSATWTRVENLTPGVASPGARWRRPDFDKVRARRATTRPVSLRAAGRAGQTLEDAGLIENGEGWFAGTPQGHPTGRSERPVGPVHQVGQGQDGPAPDHAPRRRPRAQLREQALTSSATRSTSTCIAPSATPSAGRVLARRAPRPDDFDIELTENITRSSTVSMPRPLAVDAHAGQLRRRRRRRWRCTRSS